MGPLPPPVNGMTLLTEKVVQHMKEWTPLTVANWSAGGTQSRPWTRAIRLLRAARCLAKLIFHGRVKNARLFLTCNSAEGLLMTGLFVKAARRLGYSIHLHHHVYSYIDNYDRKMAWCDSNMSANDVHLMHCPQMIDDFRSQYDSKAQFDFVYPSVASLPLGQPRRDFSEPFRIGHLSNLTVEKGLDLVLDTFRALHERGRNVQLILAGPFGTPEARSLVAAALENYPGLVLHIGAVYDQRKIDYLNSIDCFLFPTKYNCEAWPIALNEALDAGLPVIATNRGAIRTLVGGLAGPVIDEKDYVNEAVGRVEAWMDSRQLYLTASQAAFEQASLLRREAAMQLERVMSRICARREAKSIQAANITG